MTNDKQQPWSLISARRSVRNMPPMRQSLWLFMLLALLLAALWFAFSFPTAYHAWRWNALSIATIRWFMAPDATQARRWEAKAATHATAINVTPVRSPEQLEWLQRLKESFISEEESGLQAVNRILADGGSATTTEAKLQTLLERLSAIKPMFLMGIISEFEKTVQPVKIQPGWRLLGFDLGYHRLRPTEQEPILLYWERDSSITASPGRIHVNGWELLWSGQRVYQLGTITKLFSQVGVGGSLPGGRQYLHFTKLSPVDPQGLYVVSIRMRVRGDGQTVGCFRAHVLEARTVEGRDQIVDLPRFCTGNHEWSQMTFIFDLRTWPGEWRELVPYIARTPAGPSGEVQEDNLLLFPLNIEVLAKVESW